MNEPVIRAADTAGSGAREVPCPSCGAYEPEAVYQLMLSSIVCCKRCSQHYLTPLANEALLLDKLQQWAQEDVLDEERLRIAFEPGALEMYRWFLSRVAKFSRGENGRLLDVGCATGGLLSAAREQGWDAQGIEIGQASAAYAREELALEVDCVSLFEAGFGADEFDAITMVEVIEHLENPGGALDQVHRWLRPDGLVLLTTPNYNALFRRLFGTRWWVINCEDEHIVLFTPDTLSRLLEKHGFEVLYQHVRGIDIVGLARATQQTLTGSRADTQQSGAATAGYYEMRDDKQRVKELFQRCGLLNAVRWLLGGLNHLFSAPWSPVRGWGEQIVIVARARPDVLTNN